MDDTHQSRPSDAASAATRKRRSSILKSQRPPRTPFSELEFHVATPTDTAKSRRVSFSRRTGVAEFVTNEATTTWKNFYEEHNKSLELSGNDSVANPPKQTIGHLGKRIFDQQFQEVEAVDFTSLDNPSRTINTSLNKVNFTEQLASLECTSGDKTLLAPQQNFEMSSFTDQQTNVFGENFVVSTMGEESGGININFSAIQTIGSSEVVDDLDQMQADLLRVKSNIFCPGPFTGRADLSEYIEVDLNTTHVTMKNDVSDMSITDTIHSPKVQEVSKNNSIKINRSQYKDLVADKENIVIFDMGCSPVNTTEKRKTIVYENENVSITQGLPMNIILPKDNKSEKRRTIVYESDAADISVTQAVPDNIMLDDTNKRKTILSHNETGNISITQALPMNIILPKENKSEKRRTIVYENDAADISVTQAVPDNIMLDDTNKRKTILSNNETGKNSITQALPMNIILPKDHKSEKRRTIVYESDAADISVTQAVPYNIMLDDTNKRKTILSNNETGKNSITQALPMNIILPKDHKSEKRRTIVYESDAADISVTQAVPDNIMLDDTNKRKTILSHNETGNISITQALPMNIILPKENKSEKRRTIVYESDTADISVTQALPDNIMLDDTNKRKTILSNNETGKISITQALPMNVILPKENKSEKRRTILYENDAADISVTQAVPLNIMLDDEDKQKTIITDYETGNISITQGVPINIILPKENKPENRKTIVYESDAADISVAQVEPVNIMIDNKDKRKTIITDNETSNISITQALPVNIILPKENKNEKRKAIVCESDAADISFTQAVPANIMFNDESKHKRNTIICDNEIGDISITQAIPTNIILPKQNMSEKRRTIVYESDSADISVTQAVPVNIVLVNENKEKRKTIIYEKETGNISVTQAIPSNIILPDKSKTIISEDDFGNISITQAIPIAKIISNNIYEAPAKSNIQEQQKSSMKYKDKTIILGNDSVDISHCNNISTTKPTTTGFQSTNMSLPKLIDNQNPILLETTLISSEGEKKVCHDDKFAGQLGAKFDSKSSPKKDGLHEISHANESKTNKSIKYIPEQSKSSENRKTIELETNAADVSVTRDLPANIVLDDEDKNKRKTILFDNETSDIPNTQAQPSSVILHDKSKSLIITEDNLENVSFRESIPVIKNMSTNLPDKTFVIAEDDLNNVCIKTSPTLKVKSTTSPDSSVSIIGEDILENVSLTQDIPIAKIISTNISEVTHKPIITKERDTNALYEDYKKQKPLETNESLIVSEFYNMSTTKKIDITREHLSLKRALINNEDIEKIDLKNESANESSLKSKVKPSPLKINTINEVSNKDKCKLISSCLKNVSEGTKSLMNDFITNTFRDEINKNEENKLSGKTDIEHRIHTVPVNIVLVNDDKDNRKSVSKFVTSDMSVTQSSNIHLTEKSKTENNLENLSPMQVIPIAKTVSNNISKVLNKSVAIEQSNLNVPDKEYDKRRSIIYANKSLNNADCNLSLSLDNQSEDITTEVQSPPKPARLSGEVVKKLEFEDDSVSEISTKSDIQLTPNNNNNSSENSSDKIKSLMQDLVTPNTDIIPFLALDKDKSISKETSTCSTAIQASLVTSSQIDVNIIESNSSSFPLSKVTFENMTEDDDSVKSDIKPSPLKKTTFGEISYVNENKAKVIPSYLKDVSDGIKSLMTDLVKPNADIVPFSTISKGKDILKKPSTCSTQVQANLIASSQIDVSIEESNSTSVCSSKLGNLSTPSFLTDPKSLKSSLKISKLEKTIHLPEATICPKMASTTLSMSEKVIIFDQNNPLNNVLLVSPEFCNVHRYEPRTNDTCAERSEPVDSEKSQNRELSEGKKVAQFNVERVLFSRSIAQAGDTEIMATTESFISNVSKSTCAPEYERGHELKDTKINTVIAMKPNKELLETSSSLTLVDDTITANNFDVDLGSVSGKIRSPVKLIYETEEHLSKDKYSDLTSNDDIEESKINSKGKKRNYSPTKRNKHDKSGMSSVDNTPKQVSKIQKLSISPYKPEPKPQKLKAEKDDPGNSIDMEVDTSLRIVPASQKKEKKKSPEKVKISPNITVQQLITEYDLQGINGETLNKVVLEALSTSGSSSWPKTESVTDDGVKSPEVASSFTSSKNQNEMRDTGSDTTVDTKASAKSDRTDWQPDTRAVDPECDSSVNVVAKIDMLPFMGSYECEWETSGGDTWAFRLLHARLRLTVRLAHRHDNATRTRVRADTPVLAVNLKTVRSDKGNSVASLCVGFAMDAMRHYIGLGVNRAGGVVALLRRCAAVARVALRWGRAMHEARLHLACTLQQDRLALKVANIPLRSVWEVTMRLQLVTDEDVPYPCACDVKVTRVVSDVQITEDEIKKLLANLPRDWGHVPRAIWKIFRYLKRRTRDDVMLGLS